MRGWKNDFTKILQAYAEVIVFQRFIPPLPLLCLGW